MGCVVVFRCGFRLVWCVLVCLCVIVWDVMVCVGCVSLLCMMFVVVDVCELWLCVVRLRLVRACDGL